MVTLTPAKKKWMGNFAVLFRLALQLGYVPLVIYLGFKKGAESGQPQMTLLSLLWH